MNRVPAAGLKLPKQPRPAQSEVGQTCEVISTPVKLRSEGKQRLGPLENVCVHPCLRACMPAVFWIESMHAYRMHNWYGNACVCVCVCPLTVLVLSPAVSHESSHSVFSYPCLIRLTGEHCFGPAGRIFVTERCLAEKLHFWGLDTQMMA